MPFAPPPVDASHHATAAATATRHRHALIWAAAAGVAVIVFGVVLIVWRPWPAAATEAGWRLPSFQLVDASGQAFGAERFAGRPWVANFFFTRCAGICPLLTATMGQLRERLDREGLAHVHLVSISVDPEHDRPAVLSAYGRLHRIAPEGWTLATGDLAAVSSLIEAGFLAPLGRPEIGPGGVMDIAHSQKLFIVDPAGSVQGLHDIDDAGIEAALDELRRWRR